MRQRTRRLNSAVPRHRARYVLYWAQMNRRVEGNHALLFAAEQANTLGLPVLFYEGVTCSYLYANARLHTFLLEGSADTARRLDGAGIGYVFYLRKRRTDANDVLYRLAADAAVLVTDDYPTFVAREYNRRVPAKLDIPYYAVDSSCVVPMALLEKREWAAYTIRPKIRKELPAHLGPMPPLAVRRAFSGDVPEWHTPAPADQIPALVAACEIDHNICPSLSFRGGRSQAEKRLEYFLEHNLRRYAKERNEPAAHATSNLSPYLHFGHISALETALCVKRHAEEHQWIADEFLEELIVRRELSFNFTRFTERPDSLEALPDWARATLAKHASDPREWKYTREQFECAATHDELWNAAQKELLVRGIIHGYYRMYWGKKIIEWSATHEEALATMVYLHDRYALDGRDPNTYTNILWCFGLHDRPWAERPIFGTVRYMSADGMKRKTDVSAYLREIRALEETGYDPLRLD